MKSLSRDRLFATPWTVAYQALPSNGFSRQGYWSGLPFTAPEDLPEPGIKAGSPALQADASPSEPPGKPLGSGLQEIPTSVTVAADLDAGLEQALETLSSCWTPLRRASPLLQAPWGLLVCVCGFLWPQFPIESADQRTWRTRQARARLVCPCFLTLVLGSNSQACGMAGSAGELDTSRAVLWRK